MPNPTTEERIAAANKATKERLREYEEEFQEQPQPQVPVNQRRTSSAPLNH